MDAPLIAATTAALTAADRTTQIANHFLNEITSAHDELEPVIIELFGLSGLLKQLQTAVAVPNQLQPSLAWVVRACADVCKRIDAVLSECGDGPLRSRRWALTDAPVEIEELKMSLEACRRTIEIVAEGLDLEL